MHCVKPKSVVDDGSLVELVARVQQLCGNDRSISKSGRLAAHLLTVDQDVFAMGPDGLQKQRKRFKQRTSQRVVSETTVMHLQT